MVSVKKLHWIGHFSGFYWLFPENPIFYAVKVKNENEKLCHMFQVTVTLFFYYGEISKIREIGLKNLDFGFLIDNETKTFSGPSSFIF